VSIADSDLRSIDAVRQDRSVYDLPPGEPRPASLSTPTVFGSLGGHTMKVAHAGNLLCRSNWNI
jgi:hypothetical protein